MGSSAMRASRFSSRSTGRGRVVGRPLRLCLLLVVAVCIGQIGCVRRRMTVRSDPPGALVYVDDYEIGTTPVSHDFTYYGTRKIRLVKDGYETLTVMQSIPAPWYQIPPLDFISDNFTPGEIRDQRTLQYRLTPQMMVPTEQLLRRAEEMRRGVQPAGALVPSLPAPRVLEPTPAPQGVGGQPVFPLPPGSSGQ